MAFNPKNNRKYNPVKSSGKSNGYPKQTEDQNYKKGNRDPKPSSPIYAAKRDDDGAEFRIEGRNPIIEAYKSGKSIEKILVADNIEKSSVTPVLAALRDSGTVIVKTDRRHLDQISSTGSHQGVIAYLSPCEFCTVDDILANAEKSGRKPLIVICDHIEDPRNLGAIIRSAELAGAHGIIIPKRRSVAVTDIVVKASAGAIMHLPICKCSNVAQTVRDLKEKGIWVWGADGGGKSSIYQTDLTLPTAIVVGSEGEGISRLVSEECDGIVSIPMLGKVNSLNVSAATAVILFEAVRQRLADPNV